MARFSSAAKKIVFFSSIGCLSDDDRVGVGWSNFAASKNEEAGFKKNPHSKLKKKTFSLLHFWLHCRFSSCSFWAHLLSSCCSSTFSINSARRRRSQQRAKQKCYFHISDRCNHLHHHLYGPGGISLLISYVHRRPSSSCSFIPSIKLKSRVCVCVFFFTLVRNKLPDVTTRFRRRSRFLRALAE